jgi:hypothetical protein
MNADNRRRALAEVVTLDAWHDGFTATRDAVDLHVDVGFTDGRVGGESTDPVRFRLRLKRARVVVIVPHTEPAAVVKASVSREGPSAVVKRTEARKSKQSNKASLGAGLVVKHGSLIPHIDAAGSASLSATRERALTISEKLQSLRVTHVQTADGDYAWEVQPAIDATLIGRPWDAVKSPRLKVKDKRHDRSRGIEPNIRVEVRCRREDLEITEIVLKDKTSWNSLSNSPFKRNKLLAAEALIRTRLFQAGLSGGDMRDSYSELVLCATIAESQ